MKNFLKLALLASIVSVFALHASEPPRLGSVVAHTLAEVDTTKWVPCVDLFQKLFASDSSAGHELCMELLPGLQRVQIPLAVLRTNGTYTMAKYTQNIGVCGEFCAMFDLGLDGSGCAYSKSVGFGALRMISAQPRLLVGFGYATPAQREQFEKTFGLPISDVFAASAARIASEASRASVADDLVPADERYKWYTLGQIEMLFSDAADLPFDKMLRSFPAKGYPIAIIHGDRSMIKAVYMGMTGSDFSFRVGSEGRFERISSDAIETLVCIGPKKRF